MVFEIFLSYVKSDKEKAKIFVEVLEKKGYSVWWDRNIPYGMKFRDYIMEKLNKAKCIIVLWSKDSVKSEWVTDEADWGKRRKIIVPVLIDDVDIPIGFRQYQAAKLFDWDGKSPSEEFELLSKSIADILYPFSERQEIKIQGQGEISGSKIKSNINATVEGSIGPNEEQAIAVEGSKTHLFLITSVIPITTGQIEWKWLTEYKNDYLCYVLMLRNLSNESVIYNVKYFDISEK